MRLRNKLALAFVLVMIVPLFVVCGISTWQARRALHKSVGAHIASLAHEKANAITLIVQERITETQILATRSQIRQAVTQANTSYVGRDEPQIQEEIEALDRQWIAAKEQGGSDKAKEIFKNETSRFLQAFQERSTDRYGEIILTDIRGAAVAQTMLTSDYDQADEGWWQECYADGKGSVFVDDRGHDTSVGTLVVGVTVPVRRPDRMVIGVLKVSYKVQEVIDVVADHLKVQHTHTMLVRSLGSIVTQSGANKAVELTEQEQAVFFKRNFGFASNIRERDKFIMGYSPVETQISTRVPSPGQRKGISGEKWEPSSWWLLVQVPHHVALAPANRFIKVTLLGALLALAGAIVLALLMASSISRPLMKLHQGTEIIGRGNLKHRVGTEGRDEIAKLSRAFDDMLDKLSEVTASRNDLDRTKQELQRSNAELEQFAYVSSHDLQEPLRMVTSYTQLLAKRYEGQLDDKADMYLHYAADGATRMQQLINDLLAYSRVSTQARPPEAVACEQVLKDVLANLSRSIEDAGAQVTHAPLPTLYMDPLHLSRLLQNLIGNAIKYNDKDTPEVHLSATREEAGWSFALRDNGIGIAEEHIDRIFVIFQRLHHKEKYPGTGIGLAVCKKIVERAGGKLWVESEPGEGSVFRFTIPDQVEDA